MAARSADKPEDPKVDPGFCDNHPDVPAVHVTDGTLHSVQRYCKACLARVEAALNGRRRHG